MHKIVIADNVNPFYLYIMIMLYDNFVAPAHQCPYLDNVEAQFEYFIAADLSAEEFDHYLSRGWRTFGYYFFRPACGSCTECKTIRVPVQKFVPSKSQRRLIRKNADIEVLFSPLAFRTEIFEIYREHSKTRFGKEDTLDSFMEHFYAPSCPGMQSEFYLDGSLVACGFLNISAHGLSSVYFIYRDSVRDRGIGIFSMVTEIEYAKQYGLAFYYPGYYIKGNSHMSYKASLRPWEILGSESGQWETVQFE